MKRAPKPSVPGKKTNPPSAKASVTMSGSPEPEVFCKPRSPVRVPSIGSQALDGTPNATIESTTSTGTSGSAVPGARGKSSLKGTPSNAGH